MEAIAKASSQLDRLSYLARREREGGAIAPILSAGYRMLANKMGDFARAVENNQAPRGEPPHAAPPSRQEQVYR